MELEEMKQLWDTMSKRLEKLEITNKQNIMEMTQLRYKNKFSKLRLYERTGAVVCYVIGTLVLLNINKLDTWYLMLCGIVTIAVLFILPALSLGALRRIATIDIANDTYKNVLLKYEKAKAKTLLIQRAGIVLSFLLMFVTIPVSDKILNGDDFFQREMETSIWIAVVVAVLFVMFVSRWGYGWYKKITNSAENVLKELKE